jgi:hypothetical protein
MCLKVSNYNVKYYKETEGGRQIMCQVVEDYGKMRVEEERQRTIINMINKNYTKEQILDIGYSEEEYEQAEQRC